MYNVMYMYMYMYIHVHCRMQCCSSESHVPKVGRRFFFKQQSWDIHTLCCVALSFVNV